MAALARNRPPGASTQFEKETMKEEAELTHENGPQQNQVFLAHDMVNVSWLCFLTKYRLNGSNRLACLRLRPKSGLEDDGESIGLDALTYLPAVDVVYVPDSRITVCLEANRSIVLYSGIVKASDL